MRKTEIFDSLTEILNKCFCIKSSFLGGIRWFLCRKSMINRIKNELKSCNAIAEGLNVDMLIDATISSDLFLYLKKTNELMEYLARLNQIIEYGKALSELTGIKSLPELSITDADLSDRIAKAGQCYLSAYTRNLSEKLDADSRRSLSRYRAAIQQLSHSSLSRREVARLYDQIGRNFKVISKLLPCWCVTNLSARGRLPFIPALFDMVVIDESSQCDIASAFPLLYRAKRAIIIGDPNQLQHISTLSNNRDTELRRKHALMGIDYLDLSYRENSVYAFAQGVAGRGAVIQLRDHHRSHADIISFSNQTFYQEDLRIATDYRNLKYDGNQCGVKWIHVRGRVVRPGKGGAINEEECQMIKSEVISLIRERQYTGSIGIVTPFRYQANRIYDLLNKDLSPAEFYRHNILIDVIHKFQGDERDCMFFSPVVSENTPDTALGFLRSNGNLFNVAVTRARSILYVVGDIEKCKNSGINYLSKFAGYCEVQESRQS